MEQGKQKGFQWPLLAAAVGGILGAGLSRLEDPLAPLTAFGRWLRELSLSGAGGNIAAWCVVLAISALPVLGLLWKKRRLADLLLALAAGELFACLYFLVNPTLACPVMAAAGADAIARGWALVASAAVLGTLAAWALLRLLSALEVGSGNLLPGLLFWGAMLYAVLVGWNCVQGLLEKMAEVAQANTDPARVSATNALLVLLAVLEMVPELLAAWVLLWGRELARRLDTAPFDESTVTLAETIARRCGWVARVCLLTAVAGNLIQLLAFSKVASVRVTVSVPVLTLALCAVLLLLCKYFRRAKAVNDDNATII